jgi:hypothetical protein
MAGGSNLEEHLNELRCRVCDEPYRLETNFGKNGATATTSLVLAGLLKSHYSDARTKRRHFLQTVGVVTILLSSALGTWATLFRLPSATTWVKLLVTGCGIIVYYVCFRFMGFSVFRAYSRAKIGAVKILDNNNISEDDEQQKMDNNNIYRDDNSSPMRIVGFSVSTLFSASSPNSRGGGGQQPVQTSL